jgi:dipeptidyl-peptidase III
MLKILLILVSLLHLSWQSTPLIPDYVPKTYIPVTTRVHYLNSSAAFSQLTDKEKLYAYHFSQAAWDSHPICFF